MKEMEKVRRLEHTGEGQGEVLALLRDFSCSSGNSTELIRMLLVVSSALLLCTGLEGAK